MDQAEIRSTWAWLTADDRAWLHSMGWEGAKLHYSAIAAGNDHGPWRCNCGWTGKRRDMKAADIELEWHQWSAGILRFQPLGRRSLLAEFLGID